MPMTTKKRKPSKRFSVSLLPASARAWILSLKRMIRIRLKTATPMRVLTLRASVKSVGHW